MRRHRIWSICISALFTLVLLMTSSGSIAAQDASPMAGGAGTPSATGAFNATVDVDGRGIHVACVGNGSPTVVYESGGPNPDGGTIVVATIGPDLAAALGTRSCSYDRAGTRQSEPDPVGVRTFRESAADLGAVLTIPELGCPCVVVGESLGGTLALVALTDESSGFAGPMLLDAAYPGYLDKFLEMAPADSPEAAQEAEMASGGQPGESRRCGQLPPGGRPGGTARNPDRRGDA